MGWGRWFFLGDLGQQLDIEDQRDEADRIRRLLIASRSGARTAQQQIQRLQEEVDELKIYLASTLKLLATKGVVTPLEVKQLVGSIDDAHPAKEKPAKAPPAPSARRPSPRRYPRP